MTFPSSPVNNQIATVANVSYQYTTATNSWTRIVGALNGLTTISATGNIYGANIIATGNILPSANGVYNLGSPTALWASVYVSANTIYLGGTTLSANANSLVVGGNTVVTANATGTSTTAGNVAITGNVTGANILTAGIVSATGNITGNYILGNGSLLTGVSTGGSIGNGSILVNNTNITANANIATGQNGFSVGPVSTASGYQVSVAPGQKWVII